MAVNLSDLDTKGKKSVEHFKKEMTKFRTGRASTGLLDGLHVEYYGSSVPLLQLGMVGAPEPRLLTIQVYDASACEAIEKAIQQADLGFNPSRDGSLIRIAIPPLNEERRKELIKKLHKMGEEARVVLRNHRRDTLDDLKKREKAKEVSADELRRAQDEVQKIADKYTKEIDTAVALKEKELLEV